jgi:uncharacterized repeat protein (TIGR01451 family)
MGKIVALLSPVVIFVLLVTASLPLDRAAGSASDIPIGAAEQPGTEQASPPWYYAAWHYRRPVTINSDTTLDYYQVLVTLDSSNFDFSLAKTDGSDVRFTNSNGTTELKYWIESWSSASQLAYVWVRVTSLASGDTTIYLYYNNPAATSASDGTATFDFFDDRFCGISGSGCNVGNPVQFATQSWWEVWSTYPMVFEDTSAPDGYRYHMLFDGHGKTGVGNAKGYAYTNDLNSWTEYDSGEAHPPTPNAIMGVGYAGNAAFAWGDTMKVGSTYNMFVSRGSGTTVLATSTDLVTWTGFLSLTLVNDPGGTIGTGAAVLKEGDGITPIVVDDKYWMIYFHGGSPGSVYLASSPVGGDLRTWTSTGSVVIAPTAGSWDASGMWTPSFIRFGNTYYVYYQGNGPGGWEIGFAKADAYSGGNPVVPPSNPTSWTKSDTDSDGDPDPVLHRGPAAWDAGEVLDAMVRRFSNGTYYLFYTGGPGYTYANGYATASSPEGPWTKNDLPTLWTPVAGTASVSAGILTLNYSTGIKTNATFQYQAVGFRANYGSGDGHEWAGYLNGTSGQRTMIRDLTTDVDDLYLSNYNSGFYEPMFPRVGGVDWHGAFHVYEIRWRLGQSAGDIDHGASSASATLQVPTIALPVELYNYSTTAGTLLVDWVYVRQYSSSEPTVQVGDEQAAVDLGVTKTDYPDPLYVGDVLTYLLTVSNSSMNSATGVVVTDTLPAGVQLISVDPSQGSCPPGIPIECNLGILPVSLTAFITIEVTSTMDGLITNTAEVDSLSYDLDTGNNTFETGTEVIAVAELSVNKEDSPDPVYVGELLTYTLTTYNDGPSTAEGVLLTDTLPEGVDFVSAPGCNQASGVVTCDLGDISADDSVEVVIVVRPTETGELTNTVIVGSDVYDRNLANNTDTLATMVLPAADLELTLSDQPDPVLAGELLTYTLNVHNAGPSTANDVLLTDTMPENVSFVSVDPPTCSHGGNTVSCDLGDILVGDNEPVVIVVQVSPSATGTLLDSACVTSSTHDSDPDDNCRTTTTLVGTEADLAVSKVDEPDPVRAEETLVYTVTVSNIGPSQATGIRMTDTLPVEMVLQNVDPGQGSCNFANPVICDLGSLGSGDNLQVVIEVMPSIDGVFTNDVEVSSDNYDPDLGNNTASTVTTVTAVADLILTKTDDPDPVYAGDLLTYTLTTYNDGPSVAEDVLLTDTLPGGVDFVSAPGCNQASGVVTCDLGDLDDETSQIVEIMVRVQSSWTDDLQNNAEVHAVTYDPDEGNNHDPEGTAVDTAANLAIDITDYPDPLLPEQYLTYTLRITNNGPSDALDVSVVDTLPLGISFLGTEPDICSFVSPNVICPLGIISGDEGIAQVMIFTQVYSGTAGHLTDSAQVSSATFDPNLDNNNAEEGTLVDIQSPVVTWIEPVPNGELFITTGGPVTLTVIATDNDQVDYVDFYWYNPDEEPHHRYIGRVYITPYTTVFDSDVLPMDEQYMVIAYAYDRVGNVGQAFIRMMRVAKYHTYLSIVKK